MEKTKKFFTASGVMLVWFGIWFCLALFARETHLGLLIPMPKEVFTALAELLTEKSFYISCLMSLVRVVAGWGAGMVAGTVLALLTFRVKVLSVLFSPVLHIIKATPVASFIILALVLMGRAEVPIFTGLLMSLPVVWANLSQGLSSTDGKLTEMAQAFCMSEKNKMRYIRIPGVLPYFTSAATTSMGLTWKACIAAEVICTPSASIGAGIYNAKVYLETPSLFAWTLTVIILSMLLEKILKAVLKKGGASA